MHDIVILGGNIAGVSTAHYLLRHVLPLLNNPKTSYKVTLVTPNTHTHYKIGAPRALMGPTKAEYLKTFTPLTKVFSSYPTDSFAFVLGSAIALDEKTQTITVKAVKSGTQESLHYDSLIIATGTTTNSPIWTFHNSFEETRNAFEEMNTRLASPELKSILIGGGGPAGIETTGEIAYRFRNTGKDITILSGGTHLLPRMHHKAVSKEAESQLSALGVKVIHNLRVTSTTTLPGGRTELSLSDGTKKTVDLYVDATGGTPNTSFLPPSWLDSRKMVLSEATTLRTPIPNVYAIGDAAAFSLANIGDSAWAIPALGYSVYEDLSKGGNGLKEKRHKQITSSLGFVPIGRKGGVGAAFGWRLPSWVIWLLKSRDFFLWKAPEIANGAEVKKP